MAGKHVTRTIQAAANSRRNRLCGATDGLRFGRLMGRCNLPAGHHQPGGWHLERRKGRMWANWRGPGPGEVCGICKLDGREH